MVRWGNPLAFTPLPVIVVTSATYIALFATLLTTHLTVPPYPSSTPAGTNLTQAWHDLEIITRQFHPYNSLANDEVRAYLLGRVKSIVASKGLGSNRLQILDDNVSNVTFSEGNTTVYFEGTNIIVAIKGSEDDDQEITPKAEIAVSSGGVLVNAHYDSVSTGYGATDDGVGVVTVLQLLSYFTEAGHWPKRTIILLLNNGEEDFLNGAMAFTQHPISRVPRTFLNLEGAGAGGRATLFRSTDSEVTKYYKKSGHPFGTVISSDGFKKRLIRSETDYAVFYGKLGLRGLDVAFMEPRARYHTIEDSTRETSLNSVWHMLSASIATVSGLASDTSSEFDGSEGTEAVWFDIFGKVFVIFRLHTLFALNITLLVVAPLILIALTVALSKADKNYLFARKRYMHSSDDDQAVQLNGWRGFFRFPIAFVAATAFVVALAFLIVKANPYAIYSSPYSVWSSFISAWFIAAWFFLRGSSAMRPSALHRMYTLLWMFVGAFLLLVCTTVLAQNYQIAGGYFATFYFSAIFFAFFISYIELFFAPRKAAFVRHFAHEDSTRPGSEATSRPLTGSTNTGPVDETGDDDATETTSLLHGDRRSFTRYATARESNNSADHDENSQQLDLGTPFEGEQEWSGKVPSWTWVLQFLLLVPIVLVIVGPVALLLTSALYQTPADGSSSLFIYIAFAVFTTLLVAPTGPFIHRFTFHVPAFLFFVCVGTMIYNLVAFPFSRDNRLKVYFAQEVDLETQINTVSLTGLDGYVQDIIAQMPSAQGQSLNCTTPDIASRKELTTCAWPGLPPRVVPRLRRNYSNRTYYDTWLDYSVVKNTTANEASIRLVGQNTRACRLFFDQPIVDGLAVDGGVPDPRFETTGPTGSREIRLWHRNWSQPWNVSVSLQRDHHKVNATVSGRVVCLWSDANTEAAIPAYQEVQHFLPKWAAVSKLGDGLVSGSKRFSF